VSLHHDPYPYPGVVNYASGLVVRVPSGMVVVMAPLVEPRAWRHPVTVAGPVGLAVPLMVKQFRPWHHHVGLSWFPQSTELVVFTIILMKKNVRFCVQL
jgi:hypothetical protein